jgi:hypothetical protein
MYQGQINPPSYYEDYGAPCLCCSYDDFDDLIKEHCIKHMNEWNASNSDEPITDYKIFMDEAHDEIYQSGLAPVCDDCRPHYIKLHAVLNYNF